MEICELSLSTPTNSWGSKYKMVELTPEIENGLKDVIEV